MPHRFADIAFTEAVKAAQTRYGTRPQVERMARLGGPNDRLGPREIAFLAARDSFYLASVSQTGWPYLQHRGGPAGFLRALDAQRLMDYAQQRRLKLLGRLAMLDLADATPDLVAAVALPGYAARVERVAVIEVEAFDWNCPQHITPRYSEAELQAALRPLQQRIATLEQALAAARGAAPGQ